MKPLLGSLVVLATFVTSCDAFCYNIPGMQDGECKDPDGELHQLASMWDTVNCERCVCGEIGIQCCSKLPIPVSYDKRKCQKIFNRNNCTYSVVERDDPRKKCVVLSWIV